MKISVLSTLPSYKLLVRETLETPPEQHSLLPLLSVNKP